jgi:hypothetical protein
MKYSSIESGYMVRQHSIMGICDGRKCSPHAQEAKTQTGRGQDPNSL